MHTPIPFTLAPCGRIVTLAALLALGTSWARAQSDPAAVAPGAKALSTLIDLAPDKSPSWLKALTLQPKLLQAADGGTASLGVSYQFATKPVVWDLTPTPPISQPTNGDSRIAAFEVTAKGTYAGRAEDNPDHVLDAAASGSWLIVSDGWYWKSALSGAFSEQQGGGARDVRYEVSQGLGTWIRQLHDTEILGKLTLARVHPTQDTAREAALGSTSPKDYNRAQLEVLAIVPINMGAVHKMELRHVRFQEFSTPQSIRAAGLDKFRLSSVWFGLQGGFFVAWSTGRVPSDRPDVQVLQLGWSTKLE